MKINGVEINVTEEGRGQSLVLMHGLGSDLTIWRNHAPNFARSRRVIRLDWRGLGKSHKGREPPYSIELWTEDLHALFSSLSINSAVLIGHSMGGMVAQKFTLEHDELVKGLILVATTSKLGPEGRRIILERADAVEKLGMAAIIEKAMETVYAPEFLKRHKDDVEFHKHITLSANPQSYAEACRALTKFDVTGDLMKIKKPTLILAGELDRVTPVSDAIVLNTRIENSLMKILPDCGHMIQIEKPELFNTIVSRFLNTLS